MTLCFLRSKAASAFLWIGRRARKYVLWAVALLAGSAIFMVALSRSREPVYGGKTISQWLDSGYEQTSFALQETGPAAIPYIFRKLRAEHPVYGYRARYGKWRQKTPAALRSVLPKPPAGNFDDLRACQALLELGPGAVPGLAAGLRDRNMAVQLASAWALGLLSERGVRVEGTRSELARLARSEDPNVRQRAAWALDKYTHLF